MTNNRIKADLGLYVQDQWRVKRLTLNYGLRFDYFNGYVPAQQTPASTYLPARNFAAVHGAPLWKDVNPRFGGAVRPVRRRADGAEGVSRPVRREDGHDGDHREQPAHDHGHRP